MSGYNRDNLSIESTGHGGAVVAAAGAGKSN